jgi:hypothetical protein
MVWLLCVLFAFQVVCIKFGVHNTLVGMYEGRPESKDRLAIKKNKQNKNEKN